jgi:uncharacterized protein
MPSIDPSEDFGATPAMRRSTDPYASAPTQDQRYGGQASDPAGEFRPAPQQATPRHELNSIRSSLLKKPLSSLLKD